MIDVNNLEKSIKLSEIEVGAVGSHAKDVTAEHLSKVWNIDFQTAKRNIDVTNQLRKYDGINHLS